MLRNLQVITGRPGWRLCWAAYRVFYSFCDFVVSYCYVPGRQPRRAAVDAVRPGAGSGDDRRLPRRGAGLVVWTAHVANTEFASRLLELHGRPVNVARVVEPGNPAEAQLRDLMVNERLRVVDLSDPLATVRAARRAPRGGDRRDAGRPRLPRGRCRRALLRQADALPGGAVPPRATLPGSRSSRASSCAPAGSATGWSSDRRCSSTRPSRATWRCWRALTQAVSFLEAHLRRWPSQWLNFYDFWPAAVRPKAARRRTADASRPRRGRASCPDMPPSR